jgi:arylsulfatase A-like enzyme
VLFMNRPFRDTEPSMLDLAPTVLGAFGVPRGDAMEGESLLP